MTEIVTDDTEPLPTRVPVVLAAIGRITLALPFYATAWLLAAVAGLIVCGCRAGWRDAREFAQPEEGE